jgi:hypothetical protein
LNLSISGAGAVYEAQVRAQVLCDVSEEWLTPSFFPFVQQCAAENKPVAVCYEDGSPYYFRVPDNSMVLLSPRKKI